MAARSLQDQIQDLLTRNTVEDKTQGTASSDIEAAALLESVALRFLMLPRTVLYLAHMARNALLNAITTELTDLATLSRDINDMGNVSLAVKDLSSLQSAQTAVLQLGEQGSINSSSNSLVRFSSSVDDFLNKQLSKNIRTPGATDLVRPSAEAAQDLPTDLNILETDHSDLLDRLYALAVGVQNFVNTPITSIIGPSTIYRIKSDLSDMVTEFQTDDSGSTARDAAVRLLADRATLNLLANPPGLLDPEVSTDLGLPPSRSITGTTDALQVLANSIPGPFTISGSSLSVTVNQSTITSSSYLQSGSNAAIAGSSVQWPITVPVNNHLFITLKSPTAISGWTLLPSGTYTTTVRVPLNTGTAPLSMVLTDVISAVNTALAGHVTAVEFLHSGSGQLLLIANPALLSIGISTSCVETDPNVTGVSNTRLYTQSAHALLGFVDNQVGDVGLTASFLASYLNQTFGSLITATVNSDGSVTVTTVSAVMGTVMILDGVDATTFGLAGTYATATTTMSMLESGQVVDPSGLMAPGDLLTCGAGSSVIQEVSNVDITLSSGLPTFSGPITVTSLAARLWNELDSSLQAFLPAWMGSKFHSDLSSIDHIISILIGSPTAPNRSSAQAVLTELQTQLINLQTAITPHILIPPGGELVERGVVSDIISLLTERNYDKAVDFLLMCKIQELFELDWQTLSYSGTLMRASENLARTDIIFPNDAKGEDTTTTGQQQRTS